MRLARRNIVVPEVLIKLALHEKDNTEGCYGDYSAKIIIEFSGIERVQEPVTVWQSEKAAQKRGVVDPVLPDRLGEVLGNEVYAEILKEILKTYGLEYLKMDGSELEFNCTMLSQYEQSDLLWRLVINLTKVSCLVARLFGWDCLPACIGRRIVWGGLDCDLVDGGKGCTGWVYPSLKGIEFKEEPSYLSLVSYLIMYTGSAFSYEDCNTIPVLRCSAIYREEVNRVLGIDDDEDMYVDYWRDWA